MLPLSVPVPVAPDDVPEVPPIDEPEVPLLGAEDVLPDVDAPPDFSPGVVVSVPLVPAGGVDGAAPGAFEDSEGGVDAAGVLLVLPVVPAPCSPLLPPPPRLHAAMLSVSKLSTINVREACSVRFIGFPFYDVPLTNYRWQHRSPRTVQIRLHSDATKPAALESGAPKMKSSPFVLTEPCCISFNTVGPGLRRSKCLPLPWPGRPRDHAPVSVASFDIPQSDVHCLPQM